MCTPTTSGQETSFDPERGVAPIALRRHLGEAVDKLRPAGGIGRFGRLGRDTSEIVGGAMDAASARQFASQLVEAPRSFADLTSISGGIDFAMAQIERPPFGAKRRVIDISGDGDDNNIGREVTEARDEAVAKSVTINAIVVLTDPLLSQDGSPYPASELEHYFRDNVIGGAGAFVMVAEDFAAFGNVILNKLVFRSHQRIPKSA